MADRIIHVQTKDKHNKSDRGKEKGFTGREEASRGSAKGNLLFDKLH